MTSTTDSSMHSEQMPLSSTAANAGSVALAEYPDASHREIRDTSGNAEVLDFLELESLMLNMDASLRVHARPHFFSWTQGLLQSLIRHELLICALRNGEPMSFHVDTFST